MALSENKLGILSLQFYSYPDEVGGAWKLTYEVNKRLAEKGHRVFLITCKPGPGLPDYELIDGIHYYRIGAGQSKSVAGLYRGLKKRVDAILETQSIDLVHGHNPLVDFAALWIPRLWGIPRVYHFHSLWYDEEKINRGAGERQSLLARCKLGAVLNVIRLIEWTCFYAARSVLFLSRYSRDRFLDFYPGPKRRLKIIPGGVDTGRFRPLASGLSAAECRRRLGLPADAPLLLTVRRLSARMGLGNLISACALIRKRHPNLPFFLVIVGKGVLMDQLNAQIAECRLQDRVLLAGSVSGDRLHLYYGAADLFVLPTTSIEGFGLATAEALASGLPVLGTPVGGTVEILRAIDSKLLFASATPSAIADGIGNFLENPQPYLDLKTRCRDQAVTHYGWDQVVDSLEQEFCQVVQASAKTP
ncbi:MAG: glycosyltransferase family 4 protein [Nitrospinales bacterium]